MATGDDPSTLPSRRAFLRKSLGLIPAVTLAGGGVAGAMLVRASAAAAPTPDTYQPSYFNAEEWAFLHAAVALLIPNDARGPGAMEAGVPEFIDRQMGTTYGSGGLWYMQGPFHPEAPHTLGYQLKLSPREIYREGIRACNAWCRKQYGKPFVALDATQQQHVLEQLDGNQAAFEALPSATFFAMLWSNTREGFFSDPIHGGNKGMVGWKLIDFPGARADFMDWVQRDVRYPLPPVSIRGERA